MTIDEVIEAGKFNLNYLKIFEDVLAEQQTNIVCFLILLLLFKISPWLIKILSNKPPGDLPAVQKKSLSQVIFAYFSTYLNFAFIAYIVYLWSVKAYEAESNADGFKILYLHRMLPLAKPYFSYLYYAIFLFIGLYVIGKVFLLLKKDGWASFFTNFSLLVFIAIFTTPIMLGSFFSAALHTHEKQIWEQKYVGSFLASLPKRTYTVTHLEHKKIADDNGDRVESKDGKFGLSIAYTTLQKDETFWMEDFFIVLTSDQTVVSLSYVVIDKDLGNGYNKGIINKTVHLPLNYRF